ncbi:MAG TPA: methyltransferase domain-containing protein [Vicinamibacterales bacterium]|nr:methyltransferase domain-containing protein [Vicinamibacterales bacterium]
METTEAGSPLDVRSRAYWDAHIHDVAVTSHPPGSPGFFADLEAYHFEKLHHLLRLVDFEGLRGRRVLDVGCGPGVDLVRFAASGAVVTGIDASRTAAALARQNARQRQLPAGIAVADGEALPFPSGSFDYVFAHGVIQYTAHPERLVNEVRRVLVDGGTAFLQVYNRRSWLQALSTLTKVDLEHEDAPVLRRYTHAEFRRLLTGFSEVRLITERFPVRTRLHKGWKAALFNHLFVGSFNALPRVLTRRFGWHLIAICRR